MKTYIRFITACFFVYTSVSGTVWAQQETLLPEIVFDAKALDLGLLPQQNMRVHVPFLYLGKEPQLIARIWVGDPHYACEYPREPLMPGKQYTLTVCFWLCDRPGPLLRSFTLSLANGENVTGLFRGLVGDPRFIPDPR